MCFGERRPYCLIAPTKISVTDLRKNDTWFRCFMMNSFAFSNNEFRDKHLYNWCVVKLTTHTCNSSSFNFSDVTYFLYPMKHASN